MNWNRSRLVDTLPSKIVGTYRLLLGIILILVGSLKLLNEAFTTIWKVQLLELHFPFVKFFFYSIPVYEIFLGSVLLFGYYSRLCAFLVIPIMMISIYTHLTVYNQKAFLFQPYETFYPGMVLMLVFIVIVFGGGKWSLDLRNMKNAHDESNNLPYE